MSDATPASIRKLYAEHGKLVNRKFDDENPITEEETTRLAEVRKQINDYRLETMFPDFQRMDLQVLKNHHLANQVTSLATLSQLAVAVQNCETCATACNPIIERALEQLNGLKGIARDEEK